MNNLEKELLDEIRYSFPLELNEWKRIKYLIEGQHVPDITDECANKISDWLVEYYFNNKNKLTPSMRVFGGKLLKYEIKVPVALCRDIKDVFFYSVDGIIELNISQNINYNFKNTGGYDEVDYDSLVLNDEKRLVLNKIKFNINCFAFEGNIKQSVYGALIHELNHAYEDYKRLCNKKSLNYKDWINKTKYRDLFDVENNKTDHKRFLNFVLYHLSPTEINAKVAQAYGELKLKKFSNSIEASEAIRKTQAYQTIEMAMEYLQDLREIKEENAQTELINYFNKMRKQQVKNFEELINLLEDEITLIKKHIFIKVSKALTR